MELDIVVDLKDRFYIFETKSGTNLNILTWADRVRIFETKDSPKCHFITCCLDSSINARIFKPCRLFLLQTLEKQFKQLLEQDDVNLQQNENVSQG